jgi:hypothetical protein
MSEKLASFVISNDFQVDIQISAVPLLLIVVIFALVWAGIRWLMGTRVPEVEFDGVELGSGNHKISFRPNNVDRQIAYSIWVELSTRKVGLPIDLDDDVISEVYDSWYAFFGVTREMIKDVPVSKINKDSTTKIINLSIDVLNEGLRPHLTKWQARYRHWYEFRMTEKADISPQELQKNFPSYEDLSKDLLEVNTRLIAYRRKMYELVTRKPESANV